MEIGDLLALQRTLGVWRHSHPLGRMLKLKGYPAVRVNHILYIAHGCPTWQSLKKLCKMTGLQFSKDNDEHI